jgi:hypothetical protein
LQDFLPIEIVLPAYYKGWNCLKCHSIENILIAINKLIGITKQFRILNFDMMQNISNIKGKGALCELRLACFL